MRVPSQPAVTYAPTSPPDRPRDIALIIAVVERLETMQWNRDVEGFTGLLTPQAVWVTAFGRRLTGWPEIHDFTAEGRPLYVMSKQHRGWLIAAGQNTKFQETQIAAQAQMIEA
jgi:hypothetical protein